jgi:Fe-S cluster assembly protein SufD
MNEAAPRGKEAFLHRYEGLRAELPGDPALRARAAAILRERGLPGREEAFKYTNMRSVADVAWQEPLVALSEAGDGETVLPGPALVFQDGRFQPDLSRLPTTFEARTFRDDPRMAAPADGDALAALNALLAEDGAVLDVPAGVDGGLVLIENRGSSTGRPSSFHPRHRVRLGAGATLAVVEVSTGVGGYLHAPLFEVEVEEGAFLRHVRVQREAAEAFHLARIQAVLAAGATYDAFTLGLGARLARTELRARLAGEGATVHLNAAQLLGASQHGDVATIVRHEAPGCASRQTVKNVLAQRSRGVFSGRIEVARPAQKTDGYQMSQALLLSPDAEVDVKPELEIYADDVKCSHGATVGELDAEALFYLRSRGLPQAEARGILVRAFLADALDQVEVEAARPLLDAAVDTAWESLR